MKPDKVTCDNCGKEIGGGRWCSDKCRKAYGRKSDKLGQNVQEKADKSNPDTDILQVGHGPGQIDELRASLTKTDKTFYDRAMKDFGEPYYNFTGELKKSKCGFCSEAYTTNLSLNKYCSYNHYASGLKAV